MFQPKLGVSISNVTHHLSEEWVEAIAHSRIETMELFARRFIPEVYPNNRPLLRKLLQTGKVTVSSIHADYGAEIDLSRLDEQTHRNALAAFRRSSIELAVEFNAPLIVTHMGFGPVPPEERPARLQQARRSLTELADPCRKAGVKLVVEVINGDALGNSIDEVLKLKEGLDERAFGLCLDVNHVMARYRELPEMIRALGRQLTTIHLSDYDGVTEKHWFPGKGVIDWKAVMQALRDIDYSGPFDNESWPVGETIQEKLQPYEASFDWLMSL